MRLSSPFVVLAGLLSVGAATIPLKDVGDLSSVGSASKVSLSPNDIDEASIAWTLEVSAKALIYSLNAAFDEAKIPIPSSNCDLTIANALFNSRSTLFIPVQVSSDPGYEKNTSIGGKPTTGNPGTLGLFSFASTTLVLSLYNVQTRTIKTPSDVVGVSIFTGCFCTANCNAPLPTAGSASNGYIIGVQGLLNLKKTIGAYEVAIAGSGQIKTKPEIFDVLKKVTAAIDATVDAARNE